MSGQVRSSAGRPAAIRQLLGSIVITFISVGMLLGSFLLSKLDTLGVRPPPTQAVAVLSPTLFLPTTTPAPLPTASPSSLPPATETAVPPTFAPSASPTPSLPLMPSCPRPPGWFSYTVRQGDTLAGLAWRAGITTFALMRANCLNTPTIFPGQPIYLPPTFYASPTPWSYPCGPPLGWVVYIVQPRDTLYSLSLRSAWVLTPSDEPIAWLATSSTSARRSTFRHCVPRRSPPLHPPSRPLLSTRPRPPILPCSLLRRLPPLRSSRPLHRPPPPYIIPPSRPLPSGLARPRIPRPIRPLPAQPPVPPRCLPSRRRPPR